MKQGNGKVWMIAAAVCMASLVALIGGMGVMATQQGNDRQEYSAGDTGVGETASDVIGDVLGEAQTEAAEDLSWLDGVPIVTWDGYYAMSVPPEDDIAEDGTVRKLTEEERQNWQNPNISGDGIGGELLENELSMEEAGVLALKEIRRVFHEDMEGLIMIMRLVDAPDGQGHIWFGYAVNFVNGQEGFNTDDMKGYSVYLDPLTGEILSLQNSRAGTQEDWELGEAQKELQAQMEELAQELQAKEDAMEALAQDIIEEQSMLEGYVAVAPPAEDGSVQAEELSQLNQDIQMRLEEMYQLEQARQTQVEELSQLYQNLQTELEEINVKNMELVRLADEYVDTFGLADLSEYYGTYASENEFYWSRQDSTALILYAPRMGGAPELGVYVCRSSGKLYKYEYYDRMEYPWEDVAVNGIEQAPAI